MLTGYLGDVDSMPVESHLSDKEFLDQYVAWMKANLHVKTEYDGLVVDTLFGIPFTAALDEDERRAKDALELRDAFCGATNSSLASGKDPKEIWPCTALEVIVSMATAMEYNALEMPFETTDENVAYFYKILLENLTIDRDPGGTWEQKQRMIDKVVSKWMERRYSKDGTGGLFPLRRPRGDQRITELWYQMNGYIRENYWG